jgi:hypothetical protein
MIWLCLYCFVDESHSNLTIGNIRPGRQRHVQDTATELRPARNEQYLGLDTRDARWHAAKNLLNMGPLECFNLNVHR